MNTAPFDNDQFQIDQVVQDPREVFLGKVEPGGDDAFACGQGDEDTVAAQVLVRSSPSPYRRTIRLRSTTKESVMESNQHREPWNKGKLVG